MTGHPSSRVTTCLLPGESVSDRVVRFPGISWDEIEALPQPLRWTVQRTIFSLLDEPVPTLADPFPAMILCQVPTNCIYRLTT